MDAWEETTGTPRLMVVSDQPGDWNQSGAKSSTSSPLEMEIADLRAKLAPPSLEEATGELLRCLRLTAPVGMTDVDRREWLLVAYDEIRNIPSCEFAERCSHARKVADHPAKIVPAIFGYKFGEYAGANPLRARLHHKEALHRNRDAPRLEQNRGQYGPDEALQKSMRDLVEELRAKERGQKSDMGESA